MDGEKEKPTGVAAYLPYVTVCGLELVRNEVTE